MEVHFTVLVVALERPIGVEQVERTFRAQHVTAGGAVVVVFDILKHRVLRAVLHFTGRKAIRKTIIV